LTDVFSFHSAETGTETADATEWRKPAFVILSQDPVLQMILLCRDSKDTTRFTKRCLVYDSLWEIFRRFDEDDSSDSRLDVTRCDYS
jgi:hypothetical protein